MTNYWALTGKHPWLHNGASTDYVSNLKEYHPASLQKFNSRVSTDASEFITRCCMARNPKHRPDIEEVIACLETL
jgi:hypothetical protein